MEENLDLEFSGATYTRKNMKMLRDEALEAASTLYPSDEIAFDTVAAIKAMGKTQAKKALLELKAFSEDLEKKLMALDVSENADANVVGLKIDCLMSEATRLFNWDNPLLDFVLDEDEIEARKKVRLCS